VLGATPTAIHDSLYANYLVHRDRGWEALANLIVGDIRSSLDQGALWQAADLLIVLRRLLLKNLRMAPVRCLYSKRGDAISSRARADGRAELRAWGRIKEETIVGGPERARLPSPFLHLEPLDEDLIADERFTGLVDLLDGLEPHDLSRSQLAVAEPVVGIEAG
jgi:hypothetical protein